MEFNIISYSILFLLLLGVYCQVEKEDVQRSHDRMAELMKHDGVQRVIVADTANVNKLIKKHRLLIMFFWVDNNKETEKLNAKDIYFLEVVAQLLQAGNVAVTTCEIMANQKFAMAIGVRYTGMIKVFNKGKVSTYAGQRSADVFVPYLSKMLEKSVTVISKKGGKKQYDNNELPKVIAYVKEKSKELKIIEEAAMHFQPMIPFFVVHDSKLAKSFHIKKLNTIQLNKPHEKSVTFPNKDKMTEDNIVKFVDQNRRQRLTKMRLENLHEIWAIDMKGYIVPVFALDKTEDGGKFFSLAKALAKHFEKNENLTFVWIDPEPFPGMIDYWRQTFEIDPLQPTLGVVEIHSQTSAWFKRSTEDDFKLNDMKRWLNDVVNGKVTFEKMKPFKPRKITETTEEEREEGEEDQENMEESKDEL